MAELISTRIKKLERRVETLEIKLQASGSGGGIANQLLQQMLEKELKIMSSIDELNEALREIANNTANIHDDALKQIQTIEDLNATIAAGGTITEEQLAPALASAKALAAATGKIADLVPEDVP
jgi:hypothetical protein